jgi:DNA-3-methyladenine glycosylase
MNNESSILLPQNFFTRKNVIEIARELLGKVIATSIDGMICKGKIVEVEAYSGSNDKACHAYNGRRTKRTEVMYQSGGRAYVYLCYGIHHLFNIVTNVDGKADAILVRALEPLQGHEIMKARLKSNNQKLTNGPGILSKAMGITTRLTGKEFSSTSIWIEEGVEVLSKEIISTKRIGIDYAEEDASLPWRFYLKDNPWVSKV